MAELKLYFVSTDQDLGYDSYDSFVVCCESEEIARTIHPASGESEWTKYQIEGRYKTWVKREDIGGLTVQFLGVATKGVEKGLICQSFNAG